MNDRRTNREELQQKNRIGTVSRKNIVGRVGRGGVKPVFLARNLTFTSDPYYKYMSGPHRALYLICETSQ